MLSQDNLMTLICIHLIRIIIDCVELDIPELDLPRKFYLKIKISVQIDLRLYDELRNWMHELRKYALEAFWEKRERSITNPENLFPPHWVSKKNYFDLQKDVIMQQLYARSFLFFSLPQRLKRL